MRTQSFPNLRYLCLTVQIGTNCQNQLKMACILCTVTNFRWTTVLHLLFKKCLGHVAETIPDHHQNIQYNLIGKIPSSIKIQHIYKVTWGATRNKLNIHYDGFASPPFQNISIFFQDLHRTGCSGFSGHENEEDRASLKRVLLGFARWNKSIGYCQGFNVIAALLLDVTERREDDALKVGVGMKIWKRQVKISNSKCNDCSLDSIYTKFNKHCTNKKKC